MHFVNDPVKRFEESAEMLWRRIQFLDHSFTPTVSVMHPDLN